MNFLETWLFFVVLGLSLAAPLGPVNLEMMKQSLHPIQNNSFILALITGIGAMTGDFLVATSVLTLGVKVITDIFSNELLKFALLIVNVAILSYLGISAIIDTFKSNDNEIFKLDEFSNKKGKQNINPIIKQYGTGFSIVVTSPWSYIWWASFGSLIIVSGIDVIDISGRFLVVLMFLSGIFIWVISFALLLLLGRRFANQKILNWITRLSALLLLLFAGLFLFDALAILTNL